MDEGQATVESQIVTLSDYLGDGIGAQAAVASTVLALAETAVGLAALIARGPLGGALGAVLCDERYGDSQKELDVRSNEMFVEALRRAPVAALGSEELDEVVLLDAAAPLAVAIDPLDGSSNIDINAPIGTIFSILPVGADGPEAALLQPGANQLAAGFVIYGPQTALIFTTGAGVVLFIYERDSGRWLKAGNPLEVPRKCKEFAVNGSNARHWDAPFLRYIGDCIKGKDGPRGTDFNTRWVASMVADAFRILVRGGVYLYPGDARKGYRDGRLRLIYEANPIAFVMEQAGGAATDGTRRILDLVPTGLHQRIPLAFGSADEIAQLASYYARTYEGGEDSPLFGRRSLFRV